MLKVAGPSTSNVPVIVTFVLKFALLLVIYPSTVKSPFINVLLLNVAISLKVLVPFTIRLLFTVKLLANSPLLAYNTPLT